MALDDKAVSLADLKESHDYLKNIAFADGYKSPAITMTASGDIATFADGAKGYPVVDMKVAINPVQDLHGYDHPWPGGSVKNLIPFPYNENSGTISGVSFTVNDDGTINVSGTASETVFFNLRDRTHPFALNAGTYAINGAISGAYIIIGNASTNTAVGTSYGNNGVFTIEEDIEAFAFIQVASGQSPNGTVKPMLRLSSITDDTYEPYSNICPITGWTGANVTRTGKNLLDMSKMTTPSALDKNVNADGSLTVVTGNFALSVHQLMTGTLPAGTYTVKNYSTDRGAYVQIGSDNDYTHSVPRNGGVLTFTYDGSSYLRLMFADQPANATMTYKVQLEYGSTATACEPYQGDTYAVTFPTEAGTVYGGTLDVTTGVLTVDTVSKTISSGRASAITQLTNTTRFILLDVLVPGWYKRFTICDRLKRNDYGTDAVGFSHGDDSANVFIKLDKSLGLTTSALIVEWLSNNPLQFVYELATPTTYQLTPTEVKTLLGANNIFADTGAVDVEYCADTKMYIDNAIATAIATLS